MELLTLEKTDVTLMSKLFSERILDVLDDPMDPNTLKDFAGVFQEVLEECLFDNTELLEQLRLEGGYDL